MEESRDKSKFHNKFKVKELQQLLPEISWIEFLNSLKFSHEISSHDEVIVNTPKVLKEISSLISTTSKRIISNYMLWKFVFTYCQFLHKEIRSLYFKFYEDYFGVTSISVRKEYCVTFVVELMKMATSSIFVKKLFNPEAKELATNLVTDIKDELFQSLRETKWMDEGTQTRAIEKLEAMRDYVAYPEELLDDHKINQYYSHLKLYDDEFFRNILRIFKIKTDFSYNQLNKWVDETSWMDFSYCIGVGAVNFLSHNGIAVLAGILGGPFFNPKWPKYLNYGSIGSMIGHELIHGFDDVGKQFDKNGNLNNWWANETTKKFMEKSDMVIKQYSNFDVPEVNMKVNGINVQGESISDIEGVNLAYKAYSEWERKNKLEHGLPGLSLNPRQLFWLKVANVMCEVQSEEALINQILTDTHPPARYRVLGPLMNSKYFGVDFSCPKGSTMNPSEKVSFW